MKKIYFLLLIISCYFNATAQDLGGTPVQGIVPIKKTATSENTTTNSNKSTQEITYQTTNSLLTNTSPTGSSTEVGITAGELSVSLSGSANYNIPIMVPPSINGITPQITLNYNSQGGNGMAGYGWNISGVSTITRIPSTKYHDGIIDPVDYDNLDRFALDGQRLIVKNGTGGVYGANYTQYETEGFSNIKITSYGVHPSGANYGPSEFKVEYPDGSVAYYGQNQNQRSINGWGITEWRNPQGVRILYEYESPNQQLIIKTIYFAGNLDNSSLNRIMFLYKTRQRTEQYYIGGQSVTNDKILDKIQVTSLGIGFRNYELTHEIADSGQERLKKITEKSGDNTKTLNPTVFTYDYTSPVISFSNASTSLSVGNINTLNAATVTGDFDGDEKMDFLLYPTTGPNSKAEYYLFSEFTNAGNYNIGAKHTVGAFETIFTTSWLSWNNKFMPKQGWTVAKKNDTNYNFTVYSAGSTYPIYYQYERVVNFPTQTVGVGFQSCNVVSAQRIFPKKILSGDFNGDGLTDVIAIDLELNSIIKSSICSQKNTTITSKKVYFVDLKRDNTSNYLTYSGELLANLTATSRVEVADLDGDGKSDFMVFENGKVTSYTLNNSNQLVLLWNYPDANISIDTNRTILLGDYNGDGKTDFIIPKGYNQTEWYKYSSTGTYFVKDIQNYNGIPFSQNTSTATYNYLPSDYDKDGKTDLILASSVKHPSNSTYNIRINSYKNTNGTFSINNGSYSAYSPYDSDINLNSLPIYLPTGRGIQSKDKPYNPTLEIAFINNNKINYFNSGKDNTKDHLLKSITTGNGAVESITYKPLNTDYDEDYNTIYEPSSYTENYPLTDIQSASTVQVVTKIEKQSSTDYKKQLYNYYGAVNNFEGLGYLGFRATMRTNWHDDNTEIISSISKNDINLRGTNTANYTVLGYAPASYTPSTYFINKSILTYESELLPNKVFKLKNTLSQQFNNLDNTSIESTTTYDNYNNPTNSTAIIKEGASNKQTTSSTLMYDNQPTNATYYIGRPLSKVQSVTAYGDTMTSEELYTYTNHLLTQIKKKGHNTGYVTEDNIYDDFGNITKKTISASDITPRITNYEYDYSGRFLTKSIDIEGLATTYNYNANNGLLDSEINPYGLTTSYLYDSWFKKTKTTDYLGKSNTYAYTRVSEKTKLTNTGDDGSYSEELYDDLGRKIKSTVKDINGNSSNVSYLYDIYDRNYKVSEPYFGGGATQWNETQFDEYGRIINSIAFTGKTTTISYSGLTTIINDGTKTKSTTKDAVGNVVSMTDSPGGTVNYNYFANGNLKETVFDNVATTIEQDGWGRKTKLTDPSAGIYTYTYNSLGEILNETTPNGTTTYNLNGLGKLTQKTIVGTNTNSETTYTYDATSKLLTLSVFKNILENNSLIQNSFEYDQYQRMYKTIETTPFATFTKQFSFDAFGRNDKETTTGSLNGKSSAKTIQNTYKNGFAWQILDDTSQQVLWQTNSVNARGQLTGATLGNYTIITNTYDQYGFPTQIKHYRNVTSFNVMTLNTVFDPQRGNLTSRTNSLFNTNDSFTYDTLDRLTSYPNGLGQINQAYDDKGKITQNNIGTYNYSNTAKPYQNTSITVTPEALTYYQSKPTQNITYNTFKSPVQIEETGIDKISFTYNDGNNRSTMYYGSLDNDKLLRPLRKHYSADGSMEIKENILTGVVELVTFIGGDAYKAPIMLKSDGTTQNYLYLHRDYQGSILAITDANASILEKRLFDAWGAIISVQNGAGITLNGLTILDRGYTGHEHLQSVGLIHMNGRLYDPKLHRFLQPDNYVQDPSNTQNYNRYGYCWNNPLKHTDVTGEWIHILVGAIIGGVVNWATHGAQFNAKGLGYFGVGAAAGALTALGAGGVSSALAGGSFSAGALGTSAALSVGSGFASGAVVGASGGLVGGFATGFGNSLVDGKNIGDSFKYGIRDGALGAVTGGIAGGLVGGIQASREGTNFWTGEGTSEYSNNLSIKSSDNGLNYNNESARNFSASHEELNRLSKNVNGLYADGSYPNGYSSINGQISGPNGSVHAVTTKTGVFKKSIDVYLSKSAFVSKPQLYMTMHHEYMHAYFFANNIQISNGGHDVIHNWHYAQATKWGIPVNVRTIYFSNSYRGIFSNIYSKYGFKVINYIP